MLDKRLWFFNLKKDGDSAIVRLLHSSPDTIESFDTHRIVLDGKNKRIRCLGQDCPLCEALGDSEKRIYIHLYNYDENMEMVWDRTDKILPQLVKLYEDWKPLNSAVFKITRKGDEFPKYDIVPINPTQYKEPPTDSIDINIAKFYSMHRDADAIKQFLETGKFPEKKEYVPKNQYYKKKEETVEESKNLIKEETADNTVDNNDNTLDSKEDVFDLDPFSINNVVKPRRV